MTDEERAGSPPTLEQVNAELARMEEWVKGQFLVLPESREGQYIEALRAAKRRLEGASPPPAEPESLEQWVREILSAVRADRDLFREFAAGVDPQTMTAGDLVFPANRLAGFLVGYRRKVVAAEREACARVADDFAEAEPKIDEPNAGVIWGAEHIAKCIRARPE